MTPPFLAIFRLRQLVFAVLAMDLALIGTSHADPTTTVPLLRLPHPKEGGEITGQTMPGPFPETLALTTAETTGPQAASLDDPQPVSQGTLSGWIFLPETVLSGPHNPAWRETVMAIPGVCRLEVSADAQCLGFYFKWEGKQQKAKAVRCLIPGMPGPGWHHMAAVWDIDAGYHNLYIDGCPAQTESGRTWDSPPTPKVSQMQAGGGRVVVWNASLYNRIFSADDIRRELSVLYAGSSDLLIGARPLGKLELDTDSLEVIYQEDFTDEKRRSQWVLEGPGVLDYTQEGLSMKSSEPDGKSGHIVYWLDKKLPADFVCQWEVKIVSEHGLNIVFFCATGPQGVSIFDSSVAPRDGSFKQYHSGDIDCYHISYYADAPFAPGRATTNLRKNAGFYLVANGPQGIPGDSHRTHEVTLVKRGGTVQLAVDGELSIDWYDNGTSYGPVWSSGRFGLRQMQWTNAVYRNLRIYKFK